MILSCCCSSLSLKSSRYADCACPVHRAPSGSRTCTPSNPLSVAICLHGVPFCTPQLKSFALVGGDDDCSPSSVKLIINRDDVDFTNAADLPAAQTMEMLAEHDAQLAADYPLKQHKFNNVRSVTLFVPDSFGGDFSRINFLGFKGLGTGIDYRGQVECVYESRAQLKDHKTPADEQGAAHFLS